MCLYPKFYIVPKQSRKFDNNGILNKTRVCKRNNKKDRVDVAGV